uniref:C3H1-type domain-containing protein n=1 Tax=Musa acuminata subsp. malaccensis TaxID=214687 RepID=A0A804HWK2_MUSAM|nr:PREDICTED: uncharacterized protein LOC103973599 isoform X1 [Musa acuminata subsp. malaccensis]
MYGQGNYGQYPHGLPTQRPPSFQPAPPGLPPPVIHHTPPPHPQSQQTPPCPPPVPYQLGPPAPLAPQPRNIPPPAPGNMGQPYRHPIPPPYAPPRPFYPPPMLSHGGTHVPPSMPPPPRVYPPLPPPPSQDLYRTPPPPPPSTHHVPTPPPPSIQHVPAPPPPYPARFASITPAPFSSSASMTAENVEPPSLPPPPPPPPPSSPPPIPPSPPPVAFPFMDNAVVSNAITTQGDLQEHVAVDAKVSPAQTVDLEFVHGTFPTVEAFSAEKKISWTGESSRELPSPPPKPIEQVVRNIEVLCQFIAKIGPKFENMAREKEVGNPRFAFLYGGQPGSDAAIGYEYFQWMKKKCCLQMEQSKEPEKICASFKPSEEAFSESVYAHSEAAISSPASSDMDMEDDDGPPNSESGHNKLVKELVEDSTHVADDGHGGELSRAFCITKEQLTSKEDVSSIRLSPGVAECSEDADVPKSATQLYEDASLVNVQSAAANGKNIEVPKVFIKDDSPFRLIQGYASDDSGEEVSRNYNDTSQKDSSMTTVKKLELCLTPSCKNDPTVDTRSSNQADSKTSPSIPKGAHFGHLSLEKSASPNVVYCSTSTTEESLDDEIRNLEPSKDHGIIQSYDVDVDQVGKNHSEDAKQESSKPNLDEFGRLVREGVSDSDSDGMQCSEKCDRGRSSSRSWSPQERRHRWRNYSPGRRYNRNRSRSRSPRCKASKAYRHPNSSARQERVQPPECFSFVQGRCFRGASCRFFHPDIGRNRTMQKSYKDPRQDWRKLDVQGEVLYSESSHFSSKMYGKEFKNLQQENTVQSNSELAESGGKTTKDGVGEKKVALGCGIDNPISRVGEDDIKQEDSFLVFSNMKNQLKGMQQVENFPEAHNLGRGREAERLVESDDPKPAKSLTVQSSPAGESEGLIETVLEQHNQGHLSQSPLDQSLANYSTESPISTPQKKLQMSTLSATDNNPQLQPPEVQGRAPSLIFADNMSAPLPKQQPSENLLPPGIVYHSQCSQTDMLYPNLRQTASEPHSQSIHTPNAMQSDFPVPPLSHEKKSPIRPSVTVEEYSQLHFHQNTVPPRNDVAQPSSEPHLLGGRTCPQPNDFTRPLYSAETSHQPPLLMVEHKSFPMVIQQDRPLAEDDCFPGLPKREGPQISDLYHREYRMPHQSFVHEDLRVPLPGHIAVSFSHGSNMPPQSLHLPRESLSSAQSLPGDLLRPSFLPRKEYPYVKEVPYSNHQTSFAQQYHTSSSFISTLGGPGTVDSSIPKFPPESDLPSQMSGISIPKTSISMHYNPFASTFEHGPAASKFGFGVPGRGNGTDYSIKYESSLSSSHGSVGGIGSRIMASPSNFRISEDQFLPKIGGFALETPKADLQKQFIKEPTAGALYDPLFDSIEPSSGTLKVVHVQKQGKPSIDDGPLSKFSSLSRPLDVARNSEQKDGVGNELKSEVDDFDEVTTDAEVGVVENESPQLIDGKDWSPDMPAEVGNSGAGEIEIDQVQSTGKSKKTKDSRSMKLFKVALAEFVKEVLKPSWRQGNMSKEAFKTIVKKTVDKVSGSVPSHQIPKTQAKINQYVESSQRKLTKLVMGYVDKYVKM